MNLEKDIDRAMQGVTSSSSKKKVIRFRVVGIIDKAKKVWYSKLLEKLLRIKHGELSLEEYIKEVESKITNND